MSAQTKAGIFHQPATQKVFRVINQLLAELDNTVSMRNVSFGFNKWTQVFLCQFGAVGLPIVCAFISFWPVEFNSARSFLLYITSMTEGIKNVWMTLHKGKKAYI